MSCVYDRLLQLGYLWSIEAEDSGSCLINIPSAEYKRARAARIERLTAAGLAIEAVGGASARITFCNRRGELVA